MKRKFIKGTQCKIDERNLYFSLDREMELNIGDTFTMRLTAFSPTFTYKVVDNRGFMLLVEEIGYEDIL